MTPRVDHSTPALVVVSRRRCSCYHHRRRRVEHGLPGQHVVATQGSVRRQVRVELLTYTDELKRKIGDPTRHRKPCRTKERIIERRDSKHKGNAWKAVTFKELKGRGWIRWGVKGVPALSECCPCHSTNIPLRHIIIIYE